MTGLLFANIMRGRTLKGFKKMVCFSVFDFDELKRGDKVVCVDEKMGNIGAVLENGKTYTVKEYISREACAILCPAKNHWQENGGRIKLEEMPNLEWFGRRFMFVE